MLRLKAKSRGSVVRAGRTNLTPNSTKTHVLPDVPFSVQKYNSGYDTRLAVLLSY